MPLTTPDVERFAELPHAVLVGGAIGLARLPEQPHELLVAARFDRTPDAGHDARQRRTEQSRERTSAARRGRPSVTGPGGRAHSARRPRTDALEEPDESSAARRSPQRPRPPPIATAASNVTAFIADLRRTDAPRPARGRAG